MVIHFCQFSIFFEILFRCTEIDGGRRINGALQRGYTNRNLGRDDGVIERSAA